MVCSSLLAVRPQDETARIMALRPTTAALPPYYGGRYDSIIPYRVYDESYYGPSRSYGRSHAREHEALEHKYDKAMNRLDRQEREVEQKIIRRYDGNTADPRFQEQARRIDEKYDHKRGKVERNIAKEHREYHQDRW